MNKPVITIEMHAHPPFKHYRGNKSVWMQVLEAATSLKIPFGETESEWMGIHDLVSGRMVEACRAAVTNHARKLHSKENGWAFETLADNDEAEGRHSLYVRKYAYKSQRVSL